MIAGPDRVNICDKCVVLCADIIAENKEEPKGGVNSVDIIKKV